MTLCFHQIITIPKVPQIRVFFFIPNICWLLSLHTLSKETENTMIPDTSHLCMLPISRIISAPSLNLSCGGFFLLGSATLKFQATGHRCFRGLFTQLNVSFWTHAHSAQCEKEVPSPILKQLRYNVKLRQSLWGKWGHHFSLVKPALLLTLLLSLWNIPSPYPGRPFPCLCHSFHCASTRVCTAEQWLRPGNWSNWKLNYFFFLAVLLLPSLNSGSLCGCKKTCSSQRKGSAKRKRQVPL